MFSVLCAIFLAAYAFGKPSSSLKFTIIAFYVFSVKSAHCYVSTFFHITHLCAILNSFSLLIREIVLREHFCDGPESSSGELDRVCRDLSEHVDSVIGHGPQAGAGGGDHGAGGADQVGWDLADKARACNQHVKSYGRRGRVNIARSR